MKQRNTPNLPVQTFVTRDSVVAFVCRAYTEYRLGSGDSAYRYIVMG